MLYRGGYRKYLLRNTCISGTPNVPGLAQSIFATQCGHVHVVYVFNVRGWSVGQYFSLFLVVIFNGFDVGSCKDEYSRLYILKINCICNSFSWISYIRPKRVLRGNTTKI